MSNENIQIEIDKESLVKSINNYVENEIRYQYIREAMTPKVRAQLKKNIAELVNAVIKDVGDVPTIRAMMQKEIDAEVERRVRQVLRAV